MEQQLLERSGNKCELCEASAALEIYEVKSPLGVSEDSCAMLCDKCISQLAPAADLDSKHLGSLRTSIWSPVPAVQVLTWRLLNRLKSESWASDSLESMYLDDATLAWAQSGLEEEGNAREDIHQDCNGAALQAGNTVVLIKSLDVKGSQLNAKMGTVVKNIRLVENNTDQIEGKIEGQTIVILTKYVRKQGV